MLKIIDYIIVLLINDNKSVNFLPSYLIDMCLKCMNFLKEKLEIKFKDLH